MEPREALTIRFPGDLLDRAREVKTDEESLNELVVRSVEREVRRRQGLQAYEKVMQVREEMKREGALSSDSTSLIHALREGRERRD